MIQVFYHAGCYDGFCAAWLFHKWKSDAVFTPCRTGKAAPTVNEGDLVYVLDFSFSEEEIRKMLDKAAFVQVIDHHETALRNLENFQHDRFNLMYDVNESGGSLTLKFLKTRTVIKSHWLVDYTRDYDLWRHQLPNTHEINAAIQSHPFNFELWDSFDDIEKFQRDGEAILRYRRQLIERILVHTSYTELGGHKVPQVNSPILQSELGSILAENEPFAAVYYVDKDGQLVYSLRGTGKHNLSEIAEVYDGGGHFNSAGFTLEG